MLVTLESASFVFNCLTKTLMALRLIWVSGKVPKAGRMWLRRWLR
jgi:hypothetical protein